MTVSEKLSKIYDLHCELSRLRLSPDAERERQVREEIKSLAVVEVMEEVNRRLGLIEVMQALKRMDP